MATAILAPRGDGLGARPGPPAAARRPRAAAARRRARPASCSGPAPGGGAPAPGLAIEAIRARLTAAVQAELDESRAQLASLYMSAPPARLRAEGLALFGLAPTEGRRMYSTLCWELRPAERELLPFHSFTRGDAVQLVLEGGRARGAPPAAAAVAQATVLEVHGDRVVVTAAKDASDALAALPAGVRLRLERAAQETTARRQLEALAALGRLREPGSRGELAVRAVVLQAPAAAALAAGAPEWMAASKWRLDVAEALADAGRPELAGLNASQRAAVAAALTRRVTLWQGPPGTGKTRTLLAFIRLMAALAAPRRAELGALLAVADTNAAADNLLEGLLAAGVRAVRCGQPAKVRPELRRACLDAMAEAAPDGVRAAALREASAAALARARAAARAGALPPAGLAEAERDAARAWADADADLAAAAARVLARAAVVVATCSGAGEARLKDFRFRVVALDEATQATEASSLVPLVAGAECVVMAGDPRQLPPTVVSAAAAALGLGTPLFERLAAAGVRPLLLDTQYRMHPALAAFSSAAFYAGAVRSGVAPAARPPLAGFPGGAAPLAFLPCAAREERARGAAGGAALAAAADGGGGGGGASYRNPAQAELAAALAERLLAANPGASVAVLTPYSAQARALAALARARPALAAAARAGRLAVSTVDGFQGREADAVVLSTVRCNAARRVGFLADARRLNVALTRARAGLAVLGCPATLAGDATWAAWLRHAGHEVP